jgi:hypothetical protein
VAENLHLSGLALAASVCAHRRPVSSLWRHHGAALATLSVVVAFVAVCSSGAPPTSPSAWRSRAFRRSRSAPFALPRRRRAAVRVRALARGEPRRGRGSGVGAAHRDSVLRRRQRPGQRGGAVGVVRVSPRSWSRRCRCGRRSSGASSARGSRGASWRASCSGLVGVVVSSTWAASCARAPRGASCALLAPMGWASGRWRARLPMPPEGMMRTAAQMLCGGARWPS